MKIVRKKQQIHFPNPHPKPTFITFHKKNNCIPKVSFQTFGMQLSSTLHLNQSNKTHLTEATNDYLTTIFLP